ncbi:EAL domain-containing protein [Accumulibacter sp.]|uniref:putative bifunctional diguanylate cyclase/phosphodiesterase n=1 Tax=Accumulibacter sp. TaxID=2053492 RepID=UPI002D1F9FC5|nr:EAL domain-containing protein [Accumulibacter sp.]
MTRQDKRRDFAAPRVANHDRGAAQALRRRAENALQGGPAQAAEHLELASMSPEAIGKVLHELRVHQIELEMQNDELRHRQLQLDTARARYFDIYDLAPVGYCSLSEAGLIIEANLAAASLLGATRSALVKQRISRFIVKADQDVFYLHRKQLQRTGERQTCELRMARLDGTPFWGHLETATAQEADGSTVFRVMISDISQRKNAETELRIAAVAFESQQGMMVIDAAGIILRVNRAFTEITGYPANEVVGKVPSVLDPGLHDADFVLAMRDTIDRVGGWQGETLDRRKNGEVFPVWLSVSAVRATDRGVSHYVAMLYDITERKQAERKIEALAFYDYLTHLPNRMLLLDHLKQAMLASHRSGTFGALLFIDLDRFKALNDSHGHDKGDLLLQAVAQRLLASVRECDTVARLGGDEFVVMLVSLSGCREDAALQAEIIGEKIRTALNRPYQLDGSEHHCTASIGATLFQGHQTSIDEIMKQADLAMYETKECGRDRFRFFDPAMQTAALGCADLEICLRRAIGERQFVLHYQAQVVADGRVTGSEALLRWPCPERGVLLPAEFIPLAERSGLILPLGTWVLEAACAQLALWAGRAELAHLSIAVNVSARQFHEPDFANQVLAILAQTGANPNRLQLELTESVLVDNVDDLIQKVSRLKASGVGLSLDDFGTGYSSLLLLKRLPLDRLKIDRSFVRDVLSDPDDAAIATAIVALARSMGLGVIAEGVDTGPQRDFLAGIGCDVYQGYFFSRPLPIDEFEEFVLLA